MKQIYIEKNNCCGCTACLEKCPQKAIYMESDEEGFKYPVIREELCVDCGVCKKTCSFRKVTHTLQSQRYYAAKNTNLIERSRSRSGGFFFVLAQYIIEQSGIVYGAILDESMKVKHVRATNIDECVRMQGSKYVQSDMENIYHMVKNDLLNEAKVLFSGTACQVAGLYGYLGNKKYDNLVTVDIICHGVASPLIFSEYISFLEKKYHSKVEKFDFRDKTLGWNQSIEAFWINDKKRNANQYSRLYGSARAIRPSCYVCPFTSFDRPADISIGDYWGVDRLLPKFNDNKGVSLVIVNNENGYSYVERIRKHMEFIEVTKNDCGQPNLYRPTQEPDDRKMFWNVYKEKGIKENLKIWGAYHILKRIKWFFLVYLRARLKE